MLVQVKAEKSTIQMIKSATLFAYFSKILEQFDEKLKQLDNISIN